MSVLSRISQEAKLSTYSEAVILRFHQSWDLLSNLVIDKSGNCNGSNDDAESVFVLTSACIRPTTTATYTIQVCNNIIYNIYFNIY